MSRTGRAKAGTRSAFTLVELLVATAVLALILIIVLSITTLTSKSVGLATGQVQSFQEARSAFDTMTDKLAQATLNTSWGYTYNTAAPPVATGYKRQSSLHFYIQNAQQTTARPGCGQEVFFQSPEAVSTNNQYAQAQGLLNACGYFVQYGSDSDSSATWSRPSFLPATTPVRYRYRLMQAIQPTESFEVYKGDPLDPSAVDYTAPTEWLANVRKVAWPLADNVIALVLWPRESLAQDPTGIAISPNYLYDSRNGTQVLQLSQLSPVLQVTMVVVDDVSMTRLNPGSNPSGPIDTVLNSGLFTDVTKYQQDLTSLTTALSTSHLNFEVFNALVPLRESKWSSQPPSPPAP